jgi:hypothetical protein
MASVLECYAFSGIRIFMNILFRLGKYSLYRIEEYVPTTLLLSVSAACQTTSNTGKRSEVLIKKKLLRFS